MKKLFYSSAIFILLLLQGCLSIASNAYHRGNIAYQQKHYQLAFNEYHYAAEHDSPLAQYALGYMYYYGMGTKQNLLLAVTWIKKAADYGSRNARRALVLINKKEGELPWAG